MTDTNVVNYSTEYSNDVTGGIYIFVSKLSYVKGDVITGTFTGDIVKVSTVNVTPVTEGSFNMLIEN